MRARSRVRAGRTGLAGLTLVLMTLGFTLLGETLRDVLDPRLAGTRAG